MLAGGTRPASLGIAPFAFVALWSGGLTAIRLCLRHVEPLTPQVLRHAAVVLILLPIWLVLRPAWPGRATPRHLCRTGLLVQFARFASMNRAMRAGMGAGTIALLIGPRPLAVAVPATLPLAVLPETMRVEWAPGLVVGLS